MSRSNGPEFVDVHAHFLTDEYVGAAVAAGIEHPDGVPLWPSWNIDQQISLMQDNGIRHSILSLSSPGVSFAGMSDAPALARHINEFAVHTVSLHPDRFSFFACLPLPDVDGAVAAATRMIDHHAAAGVIVMSNNNGQYLGNPALDPLWRNLNERRSIVFVHPTSPPDADTVSLGRPCPAVEFMFETTRTITDLILANVTGRYPDIRFLIPHCGAALPLLSARIEQFRCLWPAPNGDPPGPLTTDTQLRRFWFDLAGYPLPTQARVLSNAVGIDRILYGSDSCWTPDSAVGQQIIALDADVEIDWRRVTAENVRRLLGHVGT